MNELKKPLEKYQTNSSSENLNELLTALVESLEDFASRYNGHRHSVGSDGDGYDVRSSSPDSEDRVWLW